MPAISAMEASTEQAYATLQPVSTAEQVGERHDQQPDKDEKWHDQERPTKQRSLRSGPQ
jgi:hypothetical protein